MPYEQSSFDDVVARAVDHDVDVCPGHESDMTDIGQHLLRCVCGRVWTRHGNEHRERGAFHR